MSKIAILAIDGGGTRTRAGLYDEAENLLAEAEGDATNLTAVPVSQVVRTIVGLARELSTKANCEATGIVAGISGAGRTGTAQDVATGLAIKLGVRDVTVCSDAHMLSWANLNERYPVLVIAGTGSVVITRRRDGSRVITGGYGPILGDDGSAHRVAIEGIRRADENSELQKELLQEVGLDSLPQLYQRMAWSKPSEVAALASVVTRLAEHGNPGAVAAVRDQAEKLAVLARRGIDRADIGDIVHSNPCFLIAGGLMECEVFRDAFVCEALSDAYTASVTAPPLNGHRAALEIRRMPSDAKFLGRPRDAGSEIPALAATERFAEAGWNLDEMDVDEISFVMGLQESQSVLELSERDKELSPFISGAAASLRAGGRIVYAGAGTSGRLGVLDASECPPTFGVDEGRVIGLIAGGDAALRHSIEGAEDDTGLARRDIDAISPPVGKNDIVIGITASGTTPYALAAIDRAKELGAKTGLVACNPVPLDRADHVIALDTGPEVLPGSTRLKAGTATKIVLNQISTGAMAKAGYVFEGRMVGVRPLNKKLRARCIRIIAELTKEDEAVAEKRLDQTDGSIRLAVLMARKGLTSAQARKRLDAAQGVLRDALEME